MTTFTTRNQSKIKYYYFVGVLIAILTIGVIIYKSLSADESDLLLSNQLKAGNSSAENAVKISYVTVSTDFGDIKGISHNIVNNVTVNAFLGVPYAAPPVRSLRFKNTAPLQAWTGIYNALQQPSACLQTDSPLVLSAFRFLNSSSSEDCLYLNIWAPQSQSEFWPVLVYIPGGVFSYGGVATEELDGSILAAQEKVIVVTIQYRLGLFGFINFDGQQPSGNLGLYDQREALKWIHQNINKFGGDSDQITVIGHGAGAISAGIHMISADSKNYFQKAILQGFSLMMKDDLFKKSFDGSKEIAKRVNCLNASKIIECINGTSVDTLLEAQTEILEDNPLAFRPLIPHEFVSTYPSESLDSIDFQTDFMFGINSEDDSLIQSLLKNIEDLKGRATVESNDNENINNDTEEEEEEPESEKENTDDEEKVDFENSGKEEKDDNVDMNTTIANNKTDLSPTTTTESSNETDSDDYEEVKEDEEEDEKEGERRRRKRRDVHEEYDKEVVCPLLSISNSLVDSDRSVYIYQLNEFPSYHDEVVFGFGYPLKYSNLYDKEEVRFSKYIMKNWAQFARTGDLSEVETSNEEWLPYNRHNLTYMKMSISKTQLKSFNSDDCVEESAHS